MFVFKFSAAFKRNLAPYMRRKIPEQYTKGPVSNARLNLKNLPRHWQAANVVCLAAL